MVIEIKRRMNFLIISNAFVLILVFLLSNESYAQLTDDLHQRTLYELANHTSSIQSSGIPVGHEPVAIINYGSKIYVTNSNDNTVSVIDGITNTKIKDIPVRDEPEDISIDPNTNTAYVTNVANGTVSVIDLKNNVDVKNITVGNSPENIIYHYLNKIYVTNVANGTVSVIDAKNNTKIKDIQVGTSPKNVVIARDTMYVANGNNKVIAINGTTYINIKNISVGDSPSVIRFNPHTNTIYVANSGSDTVSVIDVKNNTNIKNITVGDRPQDIVIPQYRNTIYVANSGSDTVSVIDGDNNTKIKDIKVGRDPSKIGINDNAKMVYVLNHEDGTISVINSKNNTKIKDIKVGRDPSGILIGPTKNSIYVVNQGDDTVSVIDDIANKVVSGATFEINPFNSGHIECDKDKLIVPLSKQFYINSGALCTAKPSQGFEFVNWQENLNGNTTQLLQVASSPSIFDSILDIFHMNHDKQEATLPITKFGNFTANFKALPPPVPAEYIATLFSVVVTAFVGTWLTPTVIGWRKTRNQGKKLEYYHNLINSLYDDNVINEKDIGKLNNLKNKIATEYTKGKINKEQFDKLVDETSIKYGEIFRNEIDSLSTSKNEKDKQLADLAYKIDDIYNNGKINKEQFDKLKEEISLRYRGIFKHEVDSLDNLSEYDKENKIMEIQKDIEDAYASKKLNELHYNLLQKRLANFK
jgi:YVTN family beta-propeller protein